MSRLLNSVLQLEPLPKLYRELGSRSMPLLGTPFPLGLDLAEREVD